MIRSAKTPPKETMKKLVIDLDNTLTIADSSKPYVDVLPNLATINKLKEYKTQGFEITIFTSRNMNTFDGNVGKINCVTLPIIIDWLDKHNVPYDQVYVGKPWCGHKGFYVDDKAIRPKEFLDLSYQEILKIIE